MKRRTYPPATISRCPHCGYLAPLRACGLCEECYRRMKKAEAYNKRKERG